MLNPLFYFSKFPILKRVLPSIVKKLSKAFNLKVKVKRNNVYFLLNLKNQHDRALLFSPDYEPEQINFLVNEIYHQSDFSTFIDIGACIGFYTLSIASKCPGISNIYSFEPNKNNYLCLEKNLELNVGIFNKTNLYNYGLSNVNSSKKLFTLKENDGAGGSILEYEGQYDQSKNAVSFDIDVKIGDESLDIKDKKIILKIDVERHEADVLRGLRNILTKNKCLIQIEIFENYLDEVESILKDYGYTKFHEIPHGYTINLSDFYYKNYWYNVSV